MRSIRNATVSFGVISIDVAVCAATTSERDNISFSNLHRVCGTPVKQPKTCVTCHTTDLGPEDLIKGYKVEKDTYVTFEASEIEACEAERSKFLTVTKFITREHARMLDIKKSYYLDPLSGHAASTYGAMVHAMQETETVAIGHSSLWGKEAPFALSPLEGVMGYHILFPQSEVIYPDFTIERPDERYMAQAKLAITEWTEDLEPSSDLVSGPDVLLRQMIEAKIAGKEFSASAVAEIPLPEVDLIEALKETMEAAPKRRKTVKA